MEYYLAIATFTFVAGITPGPNNIMILASGLNYGILRSLPHYFGICIGFPLMAAAVGFGLGVMFTTYPSIHLAVKILGTAYLVFLAWKIANAGGAGGGEKIGKPLSFLQAAAFQWVNPKAWIVVISTIAAFTRAPDVAGDIASIVMVFTVMSFITAGVWLNLGAGLQALLRSPGKVRAFNITMAVLLLLSIIPMVLSDLSSL